MNTTESIVLRGLPTKKLTPEVEDILARSGKLEDLVLHNMREGFFYARHVSKGKMPEDEVFSAVYRALEHAARNYKPGTKEGIRFFAYAKCYVRGSLSKEWNSKNVVKHAKHESLDVPSQTCRGQDNKDSWAREDEEQNRASSSNNEAKKWEALEYAEPEFGLVHLHEQLEAIRPAMKSVLSDHERMVIELCYFGHYNFEEIGARLGVSRSAVQNAHTRGLRKLRSILARKPELFE
jgi:RNA polymerase sigma factor (sigma-70 family)